MNIKTYGLMLGLLIAENIFGMQPSPTNRVIKAQEEWNDAYNRYENALNKDLRYMAFGFFIDFDKPRDERRVKGAKLRMHSELTFRAYQKAEDTLHQIYFQRDGRNNWPVL